MTAKTPAKGHASKHVHKAVKHNKTRGKHHPSAQHKPATGTGGSVHTVAHHAKQAKPRGLALDGLPLCPLEAVAQSLRLAGQPVDGDEVAWLWELAGARELSIGEALEAAARFGLAGCRPILAVHLLDEPSLPRGERAHVENVNLGEVDHGFREGLLHALILGVDAPGPHAVLATPRGWWSWGQLHSPWPCTVEEAWVVAWQ